MQAIAEVNDKLAQNVFRRVLGTKVVSELLPASDYYLAESEPRLLVCQMAGLSLQPPALSRTCSVSACPAHKTCGACRHSVWDTSKV